MKDPRYSRAPGKEKKTRHIFERCYRALSSKIHLPVRVLKHWSSMVCGTSQEMALLGCLSQHKARSKDTFVKAPSPPVTDLGLCTLEWLPMGHRGGMVAKRESSCCKWKDMEQKSVIHPIKEIKQVTANKGQHGPSGQAKSPVQIGHFQKSLNTWAKGV